MTEGRVRGHKVVVVDCCKNYHKTETGGMGFVRI